MTLLPPGLWGALVVAFAITACGAATPPDAVRSPTTPVEQNPGSSSGFIDYSKIENGEELFHQLGYYSGDGTFFCNIHRDEFDVSELEVTADR